MSSALVVVPPTVGHLNHGVALARLMAEAGRRPVLVTGTAGSAHLSRLSPGFAVHCLPSHDLVLDRTDPRRRPHLEQLCDPAAVSAALDDQLRLVRRHHAGAVVVKDYFAAVLTAAAAGIPYAAYYTDGLESMLPGTSRQTVRDPASLTGQLAGVAAARGIRVDLRPVPQTLRSPSLNIVRGYPETTSVSLAAAPDAAASTVFAGALTYDGSGEEVERWTAVLRALEPPVAYATFGTVLRDRSRLDVVRAAGASLAGTMVVSDLEVPERPPADAGRGTRTWRYIPNRAALSVADVVIHHGGHGTALSALVEGVPQIVVPDNPRTQQSTHGEVLAGLGVAAVIQRAALDATTLARAVRRLRAPDVQRRAADLARRLRAQDELLRAELRDRLARW